MAFKPLTNVTSKIALAALALAAAAPVASAQTYHGRSAYVDPYYDGGAGGIIARETERAQRESGVTSEFAPGSKQTATGGPVGGIPGFSGR